MAAGSNKGKSVNRYLSLLQWGEAGGAPGGGGVFEDEVDDNGDHGLQDAGTIADLGAVDLAVPGGTAVEELVAEHIEAIKKDAAEDEGVFLCQGTLGRPLAGLETLFPFRFVE